MLTWWTGRRTPCPFVKILYCKKLRLWIFDFLRQNPGPWNPSFLNSDLKYDAYGRPYIRTPNIRKSVLYRCPYIRTFVYTDVRIYGRPYIRTPVYTDVCIYIYIYGHPYIRTSAHTGVRMSVYTDVRIYGRPYIRTSVYTVVFMV